MKGQSTGGTAKSGYKKLRPEKKKTLRPERVAMSKTLRGNAGRSTKKK